jgi:hypothetical protein
MKIFLEVLKMLNPKLEVWLICSSVLVPVIAVVLALYLDQKRRSRIETPAPDCGISLMRGSQA